MGSPPGRLGSQGSRWALCLLLLCLAWGARMGEGLSAKSDGAPRTPVAIPGAIATPRMCL